jgi:hypothetical protein
MAPSTIQRKIRLLRRLNRTLDGMLYLLQTQRIGPPVSGSPAKKS